MSGREAVWLTQDGEGNFGVWSDPDNARQQIARDRAVEAPGAYEWVNDADGMRELLLRDDEPVGLTLCMAIVADANPVSGEQQDGAVRAVRTFLDALPPRIDIVADWTRNGVRNVLTAEALRSVLDERGVLAARVAELEAYPWHLVRADRAADEADVRAVAEACTDFGHEEGPRGIRQLYARFADRIAALAGDETDGSGT